MTSNRVGSVFLGDLHHRLHLSSPGLSPSPSSSPPSTTSGSHAGVFPNSSSPPPSLTTALENMEDGYIGSGDAARTKNARQQQDGSDSVLHAPGKVDPVLALELRLRWIEALVVGMKQQDAGRDRKGKAKEDTYAGTSVAAAATAAGLKRGETISTLTEAVQKQFNQVVDSSEGLRKFIDNYDQNAHLLTPSFALSGILPEPPKYDDMAPEEIYALLAEMEPDIRAADRDMQEISALEAKGVTGAGRLPDYEKLEPRLEALLQAHAEDTELAASLEMRISSLVDKHAAQVDLLSELFVAWDDALASAEDKLTRLEREKAERLRLGLE
ncbi:hypothetical protein D9619_006485 [Psilocybe cf. subviscida]|uniref:Uncharacterized protein n=1 Tax=Psilocybe cf. subviscida TaxID=2480587 RepID=A0A8H5EYC1_9AGAR|nr:hypothetical protein D9619_006485 [Psilocybe cf. subviscida]